MQLLEVRPGKWGTKNQRTALITHSIEVNDAPQPGMEPKQRKVWVGKLLKADGVTVDTEMMWEPDGRHRTHLGVATQYDLNQAIALEPVTEVAPVLASDPNADVISALSRAANRDEPLLICVSRLTFIHDHHSEVCIPFIEGVVQTLAPYRDDGESVVDCLKRILASFVNVQKTYEDALKRVPEYPFPLRVTPIPPEGSSPPAEPVDPNIMPIG